MKDIRQRLLATFQVEHKEHVQRIREALAAFEKSETPLAGSELDDVFRRAHSLKGAARAVDLRAIENLAHRLETLFSRVREGVLRLDEPVVAVIRQVLDSSEDLLTAAAEGRKPLEPAQALRAIESLLGMSKAPPAAAVVRAAPRPVEAAPAVPTAPLPKRETLRLDAENLDRIVNSAGELLTESLRQSQVTDGLRALGRQLTEAAAERARARRANARVFQQLESSLELAAAARYVNYLDHQLQLVSKQAGVVRHLHERNAWTLRTLAGELQQDVRRARMVPAENVFEGFRRMVRELARDEGKAAELRVTGLEVEADRVVLQALKDPVMHILRNAVSHGIELEADRQIKGKDPTGRIQMAIQTRGNQLNITVEDDGKGVDVRRVAEIAVRKGMISEAEAATRAPEELMRLVLLPGFSTTRFVTELSGRGMGLSVVAEAAARLQGKVYIGPGHRAGTRVMLTVPLSVSTHRLLLVACQGQTFAIPLHGIERLCRVAVADLQTVESRPVMTIDGRQLHAVSLAHLLNATEPGVSVSENTLSVMVLRAGLRRLAVAIDQFLSERDAVIRDLPAPADANGKIAGGILLEDGSVCLVLNTAEIVEGFRQSSDALVLRSDRHASADRPTSVEILVVDDSLTTRTLEKSILEAHGYQVAVAVDGIEALNHLRTEPVGLVISDVQMPRLDGFGLLEEMKRDPRLATIPVIIVTSVENREDQARGMALGAEAYIVKRRFEQQALLDTIRQLL